MWAFLDVHCGVWRYSARGMIDCVCLFVCLFVPRSMMATVMMEWFSCLGYSVCIMGIGEGGGGGGGRNTDARVEIWDSLLGVYLLGLELLVRPVVAIISLVEVLS